LRVPDRDADILYCKYCFEEIDKVPFDYRRCVYCGDQAEAIDPYTPKHVAERKIPICNECNRDAGAYPFRTVDDKARHILVIYRIKYQQQLKDISSYTEEDLEEYGFMLRTHMQRTVEYRRALRDRLRWLAGKEVNGN
jgi:hypothetical protein